MLLNSEANGIVMTKNSIIKYSNLKKSQFDNDSSDTSKMRVSQLSLTCI